MNPLRPHAADDISESDLLAFHFHELSPEQERTILRAMALNPALMAESESVAASLIAFKDVPMHVDSTVLERNWKALRPSLIPHTRPLPRTGRWRWPVFAGAMVASAAMLAFFVTNRPVPFSPAPKAITAAAMSPHPGSTAAVDPQTVRHDGHPRLTRQPVLKADLHSGLFRPQADSPDASVHLLSLAKMPSGPPPAPLFTMYPQPVPPSLAMADRLRPYSAKPGARWGAELTEPGLRPEKLSAIIRARREHTVDFMLGIGGNFIAPHTSVVAVTERSTQSATHAIAAMGALHQQFRPALGYRITASYSRPDFNYTYGNSGDINSRIYELAGTYVVQGPHHKRLSTSGDAGIGLLAFLPTVASTSTSYVYRGAGVLAVNVDYALTKHWGARFAYRAQIFKSPDFRYTGGSIPVTGSVTFSNEPTLGVTYSLGKK